MENEYTNEVDFGNMEELGGLLKSTSVEDGVSAVSKIPAKAKKSKMGKDKCL